MRCKFKEAWIGKCNKPADKSGYCEEHKNIECCSCGKQATHTCDETGQFVCGAPLCDDCIHSIHPEGHNGGVGFNAVAFPDGMKTHCKKSEQKFAPWYVDVEDIEMWKKENGIPENAEVICTSNG